MVSTDPGPIVVIKTEKIRVQGNIPSAPPFDIGTTQRSNADIARLILYNFMERATLSRTTADTLRKLAT
ncbi:hypothetical protein ONZ51_g3285 [Trametes cubensis]|uniref:Uncharacterized protein n=1 Tax=Trametes cubensis TaxID=1111947 RepID=A0AAD7TYJ4_9APHY|nr:hypothetical protein ONZ51_g3285 [Trametes cubensis]